MSTAPNLRHVESLFARFSFYEAAELARCGNYVAAEAILQEFLQASSPPPPVLDLQARICAQQGRVVEAAEFWRKALQKEPSNLAYQAALARLSSLQRRPILLQTVWPLLVGLGVIVCGIIAVLWLAHRQSSADTRLQRQLVDTVHAESQAAEHQIQSLLTEVQILSSNQSVMNTRQMETTVVLSSFDKFRVAQEGISKQLKDLQTQTLSLATNQEILAMNSSNDITALHLTTEQMLSAENERRRTSNGIVAARIDTISANYEKLLAQVEIMTNPPSLTNLPTGITPLIEGKAVLLTFNEGIFDHGAHFKFGAQSRLQSLAKTLAQQPDPVHIEVIGYADDDRAFLQWTAKWESSLSLNRATAVVNYLIDLGLFRPDDTVAVSGNSRNRPFPSDSFQDRARNRTVVFRVEHGRPDQ